MKGAPRSEQFDDIYFSAENGLEETDYVFLKGNNLPQAWEEKKDFVIAETGFGTGLNFLAVWKLFEEQSHSDQTLDFISVEKYPLKPEQIKEALQPWAEFLEGRIDQLLDLYPLRINGFHRIKINKKITLTLIFDDVEEAFSKLNAVVDCWFLDGFTPAKNPEMWTNKVFEQMARLSRDDASYATFTAAGDVRRGLSEVGFSVEKKKGFGRKRDMIAGHYKNDNQVQKPLVRRGAKIAIIGGGLAGTACAYTLKQYGYEPVIYERSNQLASGASGNKVGLFNPRISKLRDDNAEFYGAAYAQFIRTAKQAGDLVDYASDGALHLATTKEKEERFLSFVEHWGWHEDHARFLTAEQASDVAGISIDHNALYLPEAGTVSPEKLCHYYTRDIDVHLNCNVSDLSELSEDVIIFANSTAFYEFDVMSWLPIKSVRGQVSEIEETSVSTALKCNLCYSGYMSAAKEGRHMIGATFEKWIDHTDVTQGNHQDNLRMLQGAIPSLSEEKFKIHSGRAAMRAASHDHFPMVGIIPAQKNIYVSSAFGSHGLVGSIAGAHLLADLLRGGPLGLPDATAKLLFPQRFLDRAKKKGRVLDQAVVG